MLGTMPMILRIENPSVAWDKPSGGKSHPESHLHPTLPPRSERKHPWGSDWTMFHLWQSSQTWWPADVMDCSSHLAQHHTTLLAWPDGSHSEKDLEGTSLEKAVPHKLHEPSRSTKPHLPGPSPMLCLPHRHTGFQRKVVAIVMHH